MDKILGIGATFETYNKPMKLKQVIKRVPIPFCGVALAVAALGPILEPRPAWAWPLCGVLSCAMVALFVARIARFTARFARRAKVGELTPAYFVIYVGVLAASTTAPVFGMEGAGLAL